MLLPAPIRLERTRALLARLDRELSTWLAALAARDPRGLHASKRRVLDGLRTQSLALLGQTLPGIGVGDEAAHAACRAVEGRAVAVRRVWAYFRPMFDQRLDATAGPLLVAADELVWSCLGGLIRPPPLVFLDARAAPDVFPTVRFPGRSEPELQPLLAVIDELVLPFVRLPVDTAPWELLPLAHELGHHVLLARGWGRVFQDRLETHGVAWARWSEEIFADLYSVAAIGPWALEALLEHVVDEPAKMHVSTPRYPSAARRLRLMAEAWHQLGHTAGGFAWSAAAEAFAEPASPEIQAVVATALAPFDDGALADVPFAVERLIPDGAEQQAWVAGLLGQGPLHPPAYPDLHDARAVACAAFAAFRGLPAPGDPHREAARRALAERSLALLAACSPDGERAAEDAPSVDFAAALARVGG